MLYHTCSWSFITVFIKQSRHLCWLCLLTLSQIKNRSVTLLPFLTSIVGQVSHLCFLIPVFKYSVVPDRPLHFMHSECLQARSFCTYFILKLKQKWGRNISLTWTVLDISLIWNLSQGNSSCRSAMLRWSALLVLCSLGCCHGDLRSNSFSRFIKA